MFARDRTFYLYLPRHGLGGPGDLIAGGAAMGAAPIRIGNRDG